MNRVDTNAHNFSSIPSIDFNIQFSVLIAAQSDENLLLSISLCVFMLVYICMLPGA